MSNPTGKYSALPTLPDGRLDTKGIRKAYDASEFLEWTDYARSMNYDVPNTYRKVHPRKWVERKRERLIDEAREKVRNFGVRHKNKWIDQVKMTLEEYPKVIDNIVKMASKYIENAVIKKQELRPSALLALSHTMRQCVEAKKSILFLNNIVPEIENAIPAKAGVEESKWVLKLRGGEGLSLNEAKALMASYIDKPHEEEGDGTVIDAPT